jgi:hypothetical protein
MAKKRNLLLPIAAAAVLVACGGGSSSGDSSDGGSNITSGRAVDGYLSGATVFCDVNANGTADVGEMSTTTDGDGYFNFDAVCNATIAVFGGIDTATDYPFRGLMKTPAGGKFVTPLTSLLASSGLTPAQLASSLGLDANIDVTKTDPMLAGNEVVLKKSLAVQQIVQGLADYFGTLTSPNAVTTLYAKVAPALGKVLIANPNTPVVTANGRVDPPMITAIIKQATDDLEADSTLAQGAVTETDISDLAAQLIIETEQFLQALDANLITVAKTLQNPLKPPMETDTAKKNYVSPKGNKFLLNGEETTLVEFQSGVVTNGLETIGVEYSVTGTPKIDTVVDAAMSVTEAGGSRILQVKVEQLHIKRNSQTGEVTLDYTPNTQVHIYARDAQGTSFNASVHDVTFDPISIVGNALTINYPKLVNRITSDAQNNTVFKAEHFVGVTGTFDVKLAVSNNFNVRYEGGAAMPVINIGIFNTSKGVYGPGIAGRLTIN